MQNIYIWKYMYIYIYIFQNKKMFQRYNKQQTKPLCHCIEISCILKDCVDVGRLVEACQVRNIHLPICYRDTFTLTIALPVNCHISKNYSIVNWYTLHVFFTRITMLSCGNYTLSWILDFQTCHCDKFVSEIY